MAWRDVFITNPCRISSTNNNIIVQTGDGINYLNLDDLASLILDTPQAVITTKAMTELVKNKVSLMISDENYMPSVTLFSPIGSAFSLKKLKSK